MTEKVSGPTGFDDFDRTWLRSKQGLKWARSAADVLPAWVADMDFPVAAPVRAALNATIDRGDLGYPAWSTWTKVNPLAEPFAERMRDRYGWDPEVTWVRNLSDVLQVLQVVLHLTTEPGDGVVVQTPSYPPFLMSVELMGRRVVANPMEPGPEGWTFDPQRLERDVRTRRCRVLMLVNPHNPTGRVLTRAELQALADIAVRNDLLIVADEVLADLVHAPGQHIPIASLGPEVAERTVTITSATKAFNIAGLRCAVAHLAPRALREAFDAHPPDFFGPVNVLGVNATRAAWQEGDAWLAALMEKLRTNRDLVGELLARHLPGISYRPPEAAYLAWLDCRGLGLEVPPAEHFLTGARVQLSAGETFGPGGQGWARLNFATSTKVLTEMLDRMGAARLRAPTGASARPAL